MREIEQSDPMGTALSVLAGALIFIVTAYALFCIYIINELRQINYQSDSFRCYSVPDSLAVARTEYDRKCREILPASRCQVYGFDRFARVRPACIDSLNRASGAVDNPKSDAWTIRRGGVRGIP